LIVRLYWQYVLPHLEFAMQAWNPWLAKDIDLLEKIQRKVKNMVAAHKLIYQGTNAGG
jgi:hypothetical protein